MVRNRGRRETPAEHSEQRESTAGTKGRREAPEEQPNRTGWQNFWHENGYLVITVVVTLILFKGVFQLSYVPSGSMKETIPTHSLLLSWQLPYLVSDPTPERFSVMTFWNDELDERLVKRVIGLPGDTITFRDGMLCINGEVQTEPYLREQGITVEGNRSEYVVPDGRVFVMGDNRTDSRDSRLLAEPYMPVPKMEARVLVCIPLREWFRIGTVTLYLPRLGDIHLLK